MQPKALTVTGRDSRGLPRDGRSHRLLEDVRGRSAALLYTTKTVLRTERFSAKPPSRGDQHLDLRDGHLRRESPLQLRSIAAFEDQA